MVIYSGNRGSDGKVVLGQRLSEAGTKPTIVSVDNCCTVRNKLQSLFGDDIIVYLDIFHAAQCHVSKLCCPQYRAPCILGIPLACTNVHICVCMPSHVTGNTRRRILGTIARPVLPPTTTCSTWWCQDGWGGGEGSNGLVMIVPKVLCERIRSLLIPVHNFIHGHMLGS